jgi:hypothetical protein
MIKILKNITSSDITIQDTGNEVILANSEYQIDPGDYATYQRSNNIVVLIGNGSLVVNDGIADLSIADGIRLIQGSAPFPEEMMVKYVPEHIDVNGRFKVSIAPSPHHETHEHSGTDVINVTNLSGVLSDTQHPIPSECVAAMGVKSNSNPLNHDRFQQTEITALPESQLNLNFSTHSNSNDPTTAQKGAMNAASSPSSSNPFATISNLSAYSPSSHTHPTLPTILQKEALDNADSPSSSNPFSTASHTHATLPTATEKLALDGANSPGSGNVFATMADILSNKIVKQFVDYFDSLPSSSVAIGDFYKVLIDKTISGFLYEAGIYKYVGSTFGTNNTPWLFYSMLEAHGHGWSDISKSGSTLSDMGDVPSYPIDTVPYYIKIQSGLVTYGTLSDYAHHTTHESGGSDVINVNGLDGVLTNPQHPIPSECVAAMGTKANSNPLNHDRFQQSEIAALPESQLNLNYATHSNANDPTSNEKLAMDGATLPSASNPFATILDLEDFSPSSHTHATLPTVAEKQALDAATTPSSTNPYATIQDLAQYSIIKGFVDYFDVLPSSGNTVGDFYRVLIDKTISGFLYEAGLYKYVGGTSGTNNTSWLFYSTLENHTHQWADINKSGSNLSDISDVPTYPVDSLPYYFNIQNGVITYGKLSDYAHHTSHESGGSDVINVNGLDGVLTNPQHPIPSECVAAMGTKANSNPLNHDRFQQSEIAALPESQLNLNYATHSNANDPTLNQKAAMDSASSPSNSNPFATISNLSSYSPTSHTHPTLPTTLEKQALDAANTPSTSNPYATILDILSSLPTKAYVNYFNLLPTSSVSVGEFYRVLLDTTISGFIYEAGLYKYVGGTLGTNGTPWQFYSTLEAHYHPWADINKATSKLSDLGDVPVYPAGTEPHFLKLLNGIPSFEPMSQYTIDVKKDGSLITSDVYELNFTGASLSVVETAPGKVDISATGGSGACKRQIILDIFKYNTFTGGFLYHGDRNIGTDYAPYTPPFPCRVREVTFTNKNSGLGLTDPSNPNNSSNPLIKLAAHYVEIDSTVSTITTSHTVEWHSRTDGPNLIYYTRAGRFWGYDLTNEDDEMHPTRRYAFYLSDIRPGKITFKDVVIKILLEEI